MAQQALPLVTEDDLVRAVTAHSIDEPIVPSDTVRFAWWQAGLDAGERWAAGRRGEIPPAYNGASFEAADHAACRGGRLVKWKRVVGRGGIGWSVAGQEPKADAWAERKGWCRAQP